uniref:Putative secreted peptide n=1 Tax=Anopheles braziliensis TaxID=58242 RepID=A0A2M3ZNM0_9DIPT
MKTMVQLLLLLLLMVLLLVCERGLLEQSGGRLQLSDRNRVQGTLGVMLLMLMLLLMLLLLVVGVLRC